MPDSRRSRLAAIDLGEFFGAWRIVLAAVPGLGVSAGAFRKTRLRPPVRRARLPDHGALAPRRAAGLHASTGTCAATVATCGAAFLCGALLLLPPGRYPEFDSVTLA